MLLSAYEYNGLFQLIFLYVSFAITAVFIYGVKQVSGDNICLSFALSNHFTFLEKFEVRVSIFDTFGLPGFRLSVHRVFHSVAGADNSSCCENLLLRLCVFTSSVV